LEELLKTIITATPPQTDRHFAGGDLLAIVRDIGERRMEGNRLGNLGLAYSDLGQVAEAKEHLRQCLAIFEDIKDPRAGQARQFLDGLG